MSTFMRLLLLGSMLPIGQDCIALERIQEIYREPYRPQYHFSPAEGWLGDPDGLLHYRNQYDLFWWGEATSTDLVHYKQESAKVMIGEPPNIKYFSGSVVVDEQNTAGFGANTQVAIYTIFNELTKNQSQGISYSHDGRTFVYYPANPVLDVGSTEFRDPTVFWHAPTSKWVMAVAMAQEKRIKFFSSPDLKTWTWMSDFGPAGAHDKVWECPDIFPLAVDGDPKRTKWVLVVSIDWAHEQYFIGDFDGKSFTLENDPLNYSMYVDRGLDFYASRTFRDYDHNLHRTTTLGWIATWDYARSVPSSWGKGFWSIPRNLELRTFPEGVRLIQEPIKALQSLRGSRISYSSKLTKGFSPVSKFAPQENVYEIDALFKTNVPNVFGFNLCVGDGRKLAIRYNTQDGILTIDRTNSAAVSINDFSREVSAPVAPVGHKLRMHIYVDKSSVELFTNEGKEVFTLLTYAADSQTGIETFAENEGTTVEFKAWKLHSIWH